MTRNTVFLALQSIQRANELISAHMLPHSFPNMWPSWKNRPQERRDTPLFGGGRKSVTQPSHGHPSGSSGGAVGFPGTRPTRGLELSPRTSLECHPAG